MTKRKAAPCEAIQRNEKPTLKPPELESVVDDAGKSTTETAPPPPPPNLHP